jgi:twitching motility protein PilT
VNVFRHFNGVGAGLSVVQTVVRSLKELALPPMLHTLCMPRQGLILVIGKTSSGKSTTLAAMVGAINRTKRGHIVTIEDSNEFVHQRRHCLISHREVGSHAPSFASTLRPVLREDPDLIQVGELRDLERMSLAVTAGKTGILVMGTLHTKRAPIPSIASSTRFRHRSTGTPTRCRQPRCVA